MRVLPSLQLDVIVAGAPVLFADVDRARCGVGR
jgi:hypothetical protein